MTVYSKKRCEGLRDNWDNSSSLRDAVKRTGLSGKDDRNNHRLKRQTEKLFGIVLPPHNPQFSTDHIRDCPSTLNHVEAKKSKDFVITSCTNNTKIVKPFLETIKSFCSHHKSQLLIVPVCYKNPSVMVSTAEYEWDSSIYPFAVSKDLKISKDLMVSSLSLEATGVNPLSGMEAIFGEMSAIYGHPQLALKLVATPRDELPAMMRTTGSISFPDYSASKAGGKADPHHNIVAIYVKIVGSKFYTTELSWDGSGFYFFDKYYSDNSVSSGVASALVQADEHVQHIDKRMINARERAKKRLKPNTLVWHDVHDHYSQSHHHNLITKVKIAERKQHLVRDEVQLSIDHIKKYGKGYENLIVASNHHDHLDRWLSEFSANKDPHNALYHSWLFNKVITEDKPALQVCFEHQNVDCTFLSRNKSHKINGIDVSQHGDKGVNGSRGTPTGIAKTQQKTFIGDKHSPCIEKGCWVVGVSAMGMEYAMGLGTWMPCDGIIYPNGKRGMLFYINNKSLLDFI